jgi:hypothetical protein
MRQFTDTEGRSWTISLSFGAVKRVQDLLKVNLLDPLGVKKRKVRGVVRKRPPLVTRLQLDAALLVNVIFCLVKPQADKIEVSDMDFAEALGGDAAYAAYEAFMEEWQSFFRGLRRETEAKAINANVELVRAEDQRNLTLIDQATEAAERITAKRRQEATEKLSALGVSQSATASPESSASTPSR